MIRKLIPHRGVVILAMASTKFIYSPQSSSEHPSKKFISSKSSPRLNHKRNLANLRERKRMMLINRGFELLRSRLPIRELIDSGTNGNLKTKLRGDRWAEFSAEGKRRTLLESHAKLRLTKVDILKLTIEYIKHLNEMLTGTGGPSVNLTMNIDHRRYVSSGKISKKYNRRKYRHQSTKKQPQKHQKQPKTQEFSFLKQTTSHLFVYAKSSMNYNGVHIENDAVSTTPRRYILSCSNLTDRYDLLAGQKIDSGSGRTSGTRDTKLWIPGIE